MLHHLNILFAQADEILPKINVVYTLLRMQAGTCLHSAVALT